MLVTVKKQIFESLNYDVLGWECIKPIVMQVRGKDFSAKSQVYSQLTRGQQALFMFRVYFNHASKSLVDFYWWSVYFQTQSSWSEIKAGLQYFGDDIMIKILIETENILKEANQQGIIKLDNASYDDLDRSSEFKISISRLYTIFQETAPVTHRLIGEYIRKNTDEFVQIVE
jgi:hypothetical protein